MKNSTPLDWMIHNFKIDHLQILISEPRHVSTLGGSFALSQRKSKLESHQRALKMAASLCESRLVNQYHPSLSCFSSKSVTATKSWRWGYKICKWTQVSSSRSRRMRVRASLGLGGLLGGIFKGTDTGESTRQQYAGTVNTINNLEAQFSALSDSDLRDKTCALKERVQQGQSLDSILPVRFPNIQFSCTPCSSFLPFFFLFP